MAAAGAIVITNKPINTNATTPSPADVTQWNIAMRFLRPRPTSVDAGTPAGGESRARTAVTTRRTDRDVRIWSRNRIGRDATTDPGRRAGARHAVHARARPAASQVAKFPASTEARLCVGYVPLG